MRRNLAVFIRCLIGLALGCSMANLCLAQASTEDAVDPKQFAGKASEVLAIFDIWAKASTECNSNKLRDIYHPKISFWPSVAKKPFYGVDDTLAVFDGMCEVNPFLRVTPINRYVDILGDTAVVFGSLHFRRMLNEQLTEIPVRFSFTLTREESEWKILHMQSATIPFSPEAQAVKTPDSIQ